MKGYYMKNVIMSSALLLLLSACGGGGSTSPTPTPIVSGGGSGGSGGGATQPTQPNLFENTIITKSYSGGQSNNDTESRLSISTDGSVIGFISNAENLTNNDSNNTSDAFVYSEGSIKKINYRYNGNQTYNPTTSSFVDSSGTYAYFQTSDPNMITASDGTALRTYRKKINDTSSSIEKVFEGGILCSKASFGSNDSLMYFSSKINSNYSGIHKFNTDNLQIQLVSNTGLGSVCPEVSNNNSVVYWNKVSSQSQSGGIFRKNLSNNSVQRVDIEDSSWNNDGIPDQEPNSISDISSNGRYIVYSSPDSRIIDVFGNGQDQIYLRDMTEGTTKLISRAVSGGFGNLDSKNPSISDDGNYITFESLSSNMTPEGGGVGWDVFLYNVSDNKMTLISKSINNSRSNGDSINPVISGNGQYIVYVSEASDIISTDTNSSFDIYKVKIK